MHHYRPSYFMCIRICLYVYMCIICVSGSLELILQMIESYSVDAETQTQVLC